MPRGQAHILAHGPAHLLAHTQAYEPAHEPAQSPAHCPTLGPVCGLKQKSVKSVNQSATSGGISVDVGGPLMSMIEIFRMIEI